MTATPTFSLVAPSFKPSSFFNLVLVVGPSCRDLALAPGYCFRDRVRASTENRLAVVTRVRFIPLSLSLYLVIFALATSPPSPFLSSFNSSTHSFPVLSLSRLFYGNIKFRDECAIVSGRSVGVIPTGYCDTKLSANRAFRGVNRGRLSISFSRPFSSFYCRLKLHETETEHERRDTKAVLIAAYEA